MFISAVMCQNEAYDEEDEVTYHHHRNQLFNPQITQNQSRLHILKGHKRTIIRVTAVTYKGISTRPCLMAHTQ